MSDPLPDDYAIPTLREISDPVTSFGIPPEQFSLSIFLGSMPSLVLIFVSAFGHSIASFLAAGAFAAVLIPSLLFVFRHLFAQDNHWFEHLTSHRYPAERYLGR